MASTCGFIRYVSLSLNPDSDDVVPVLILPAGLNILHDRIDLIPVLILDAEEGRFANAENFPRLVDIWLSKVSR